MVIWHSILSPMQLWCNGFKSNDFKSPVRVLCWRKSEDRTVVPAVLSNVQTVSLVRGLREACLSFSVVS